MVWICFVLIGLILSAGISSASLHSLPSGYLYYSVYQQDTTILENRPNLRYKFDDHTGNPFMQEPQSGLYLGLPSNVVSTVTYDPETNEYVFSEKVGNFDYRLPTRMSLEEYRDYEFQQSMRQYWKEKASGGGVDYRSSLIPQLRIGVEAFDKVFGSNTIDIIPQGSAELIFGANISRIDNPALSEKLRKVTTFDFQEKIQMNVTGSIGDKMRLGVNYNTEATFDFENKTKLEYAGKEDEIIKKIEAGDVTLPLTGSLITGSQSLFGLKTALQFGKLTITSVFSQQKGETSVIDVKGGAQFSEFEIYADDYDANKHFFLSQYFRDTYDRAMQNLPIINSGINIERIEIWVTNKTSSFENSRNIVAFMDIAESGSNIFNTIPQFGMTGTGEYPYNDMNGLYREMITTYSQVRNINQVTSVLSPLTPGFIIGQDYEKVENARKLTEREYTINRKLGYISLNSALNADEVLAVAYEYTVDGKVYKVGEFSSDGVSAPEALIVKLLKGTNLTPKLPTWDLMMKNIYAIGAYQVDRRDFDLHVLYQDDQTGNAVNYLSEGQIREKILLQVLNMDNLNSQLEPSPDGRFDFIEGLTINPRNGRVIFPVLEPFGSYLRAKIGDDVIADKYVFEELYDSTKVKAQQIAEKNKFKLAGTYSSSFGSEISLNALNVPQGSVVVTAGGIKLTENVDYTVDYNLGRVRIINTGLLESQTPIRVSLESNQLFNLQTKTLLGTHLDYQISDDFVIGGTVLNLTERPLTQKVNIGNEPISNTIWGLNTTYTTESQLLTNILDKLPFLDTKTPSTITFTGEFAHLIPGHNKAIKKVGVSYIDDFEASETPIDLKSLAAWSVSSTPQGQNAYFPEASLNNDLRYGFNRAKLAWYVIDPLFLRNNSNTPGHIKDNPDLQSSHFVREVFEREIFPNKESPSGIPTNLAVLNVAFYPEEKGPYNYDLLPTAYSAGINAAGRLQNPTSRWGGMMREVQTNDFEAANIQFIEFWLMDPFVEKPDHTGGELYFNLGNISEDVLKDSRKSFENGLPTSPEITLVDTTSWGRIPLIQSLVNAFDNDLNSRRYQDVGLDGLGDEDESTFFGSYLTQLQGVVDPTVYTEMSQDPSSDNFHYFRGSDYDAQGLDILSRYKKYNGLEGNSPTSEQSVEDYPTTGSTLPNIEDINRDNTLSESESYYQYRVTLNPGALQIGQNYITDMVTSTVKFANGQQSSVNWYQFRIPLTDYQNVIGPIQDFKSIRFVRLFLRGFEEEIVLRFARFDLVRSEWRKYNLSFMEGGERITIPEPSGGSFEISSVNIEENASKEPVNYVLPPGFTREIDPTNPQLQQLNEQSIVLKVRELEDGDGRAAFKNVNLDVRQYKKIRMEVHGEALPNEPLADDQLTVFIRLGSDYKDNFYEYEVPLKLTPPGRYDKDSDGDRRIVWPEENQFIIDLDVFHKTKQARNDEMRDPASGISVTDIYSRYEGNNRISVSGNPNLSNIRTIMIGVRNPVQQQGSVTDDGLPKSGEVWINELRLTDFNEEGGWAANARLQARLADFGTLDVAGMTSQPGWGSIEKKVSDRSKEQVIQYDIASTMELGRLLPEKLKMRVPVYIGYSEGIINPEYNPLDPDIPLKEALKSAAGESERDSIKNLSQDYTQMKSLNFTNVTVERRGEKPRPWNLANWSIDYSYNENYSRNINTEINLTKNYRGGLSYVYNSRPPNITPLKKVNFFNSPVFRLIKDMNFYPAPNYLSFRTDLYRHYNEVKTRNINNPYLKIDPTFRKDFEWNRFFDFKYDITKALKFDFSSNNVARIDEPDGGVDKNRYKDEYQAWKDSVLTNLKNLGRTTQYHHVLNASYTVPINKIPIFNWISASARYSATYDWNIGPVFPDSLNIDLGNTIVNSNTAQLNGQLNMMNLYNKVGFLEKINQRYRGGTRQPSEEKRYRTVRYERKNLDLRAGNPQSIYHRLGTEDITVNIFDQDGNEIQGRLVVENSNKAVITVNEDYENTAVEVEGRIERRENPLIIIGEQTARLLMAVKNISISYSQNEGTILPGYKPGTRYLGMDEINGAFAPGWAFIAGFQNEGFADKAVRNNWLTLDSLVNNPFTMTHNENFNIRSSIEPFFGLRIELTANRRFSRNMSAYYVADVNGNFPDSTRNRMVTGNFSMTYFTGFTAFEDVSASDNYRSANFERFKKYTVIISRRLAEERQASDPFYDPDIDPETGLPIAGEYKNGYGITSQEVLIPAFLAAYSNRDPEKITLSTFPSILNILPNWRIVFEGLTKIDFIKRYLNTVSITHAYRSSFDIGSYTTNLYYQELDGLNYVRDIQYNFLPEYEVFNASINEQFSPLINLDLTWKNNLTSRFEIKKSRTLALSLANNQITEVNSDEFVIGSGYRFEDVQFSIRAGGIQREMRSDLNLRADFSIRDNKTVIRKLVEEVDQPTAGQRILTIKVTADYVLSDRFNLRLFFDRVVNKPFVALTFPTANTNFGFSVRFTLAQ
ncbi:MAG: cell surface protein SprA [Bacteroidales bacterium]|nr:MAG: cell surface protein SprA [Bacteroidales bacterium]